MPMPFNLRRVRGALLRLVRHRLLSIATGLALVLPAAWIRLDPQLATWWTEGLSLVLGATGVALIYAGAFGPKSDWTDSSG